MTTTLPVVAEMLNKNIGEIGRAIPKNIGLTPDRLIRVALTEFNKNPVLRDCTPISFCSAVVQAAQMGLEFGEMKHCALVPYGTEVKLMVQYQGWLALLWRSNAIKDVQTRIVYEGDLFSVEYGSHVSIVHQPQFKSSKPQFYYAAVTPMHGSMMIEVMTYPQVEAHMKQYAKGYDRKTSPWATSFDAMAQKTVLRRLMKLLPLDVNSPIGLAMKADEDIIEAEVQTARVEKHREISSGPDLPTEDEKAIAYKQYSEAVENALKHKIDIKDLPLIKDKNDVSRLRAITDILSKRCAGHAPSQREPGDE